MGVRQRHGTKFVEPSKPIDGPKQRVADIEIFLLRWCFRNVLMKFTRLEFSCWLVMDHFANEDRLVLLLFYPRAFFDCFGHLACFCIVFNQLTTVLFPIFSNELWCKNRMHVYSALAISSFMLSLPCAFTHSIVFTKGNKIRLLMKSDLGFSFPLYNSIMSLVGLILIVPTTSTTIFVIVRSHLLSKYANEIKITILGTAFATLTSLGFIYHVFLFISSIADVHWVNEVARALEEPVGDFVYLSPVWILLIYDSSLRRHLYRNYIRKEALAPVTVVAYTRATATVRLQLSTHQCPAILP